MHSYIVTTFDYHNYFYNIQIYLFTNGNDKFLNCYLNKKIMFEIPWLFKEYILCIKKIFDNIKSVLQYINNKYIT